MNDPVHLLGTPIGQPGSGRVRYGAAMALYRDGRISAEALEVYRICAMLDAQDPDAVFRERGVAAPVIAAPDAAALIGRLLAECDRYLSLLPGPGPVEVRQGLSPCLFRPVSPQRPASSAVVATHLETALHQLRPAHPALADSIAKASPYLRWITYDGYPIEEIGESFARGHAFTSLAGEGAPVTAEEFDLGLFLIAPHVLYRDHHHKAPELYAPLTGPHGWRFAPGAPLQVKPAHQPVWNDPDAPHLTKVGAVPFLAIFGWTRDVNETARVIPADDWPALEALKL